MKLKYYSLAVALNLLVALPSQANDPFSELDKEIEQLSVDDSAEFEQWYTNQIKEFNQWQQAYLADWDKKQQASIKKWGDAKIPSPDVIVVYDEQHDARTVVDLDKGEITVSYLPSDEVKSANPEQEAQIVNSVIESNAPLWQEVGLVTPQKAAPQAVYVEEIKVEAKTFEQVKQEIEAQTERQMSQLDMFAEKQAAVISPYKQEQIIAEQKVAMQKRQAQRVAKVEKQLKLQQATFETKPQQVVAYTVKIPESALSDRASQYLPTVQKESLKRQLQPSLVLAIMHTESHFNPRAKSHVPAYGLMQIVPTTAGHDVNKLYRGKDKPMKVNDLYDPTVNIETGAAYLKILQSRYLKGIKDPQSATYSVIAAYNTGSGNVAKAFGEKSVSSAVKKINSMSSEQVYQHLIRNLPYKETRNYLKKVNDRMKTYHAQSNSII
ncbi:transglycosylase SLT domain-containing protein [Vibrio sp. CAU 1672]|uniref:transglycosylase SLT domain-containing protein n=1 Tax=Vibrio sp. CAU 1672 TaxID=3032594 RepID=UPI0023D9B53F|nr:transglycosylase SLT domain-containing protein [Vibrio sp. CAU 1672]MDF2152890.1 transglycosylase SLT domain-containing protein [Vibrio sp. CAU 1672]